LLAGKKLALEVILIRKLTASANLSAARPQAFSLFGTTDITNSDLYWASSRAGKKTAMTRRKVTVDLILMLRTYQPHKAENIAIYTGFNGRLPRWFPGMRPHE
jgi:hypothetical protein